MLLYINAPDATLINKDEGLDQYNHCYTLVTDQTSQKRFGIGSGIEGSIRSALFSDVSTFTLPLSKI
jgi:hypothetical protein